VKKCKEEGGNECGKVTKGSKEKSREREWRRYEVYFFNAIIWVDILKRREEKPKVKLIHRERSLH
jgi:hypothetical protein